MNSSVWAMQHRPHPWLRRLDAVDRRSLLMASDAVSIAGTATCGAALAGLGAGQVLDVVAAWLLCGQAALATAGQYDLARQSDRGVATAIATGALGAGLMGLCVWGFGCLPGLVLAAAVQGLLLPLGRRWWENRLSAPGSRQRVLLLGTPQECQAAFEVIQQHPQAGLHVLGQLTALACLPMATPLLVLGRPGQLAEVARAWRADMVIGGPSTVGSASVPDADLAGLEVHDLISLYDNLARALPPTHLDERWCTEHLRSRCSTADGLAIRLRDLLLASAALLLLAPLLGGLALALGWAPGKTAFDRVPRVGRRERIFLQYRFRIDPNDTDSLVVRAVRRAGLVDLPALLNVWWGDMSLVGPRPWSPERARGVDSDIPMGRLRFRVRPGLTGWAQVLPRSEDDPVPELARDLYYLAHRSHGFDATILWQSLLRWPGVMRWATVSQALRLSLAQASVRAMPRVKATRG